MFEGRVVELGWPDHHAPPIGVAWQLCSAIRKWLIADVQHVAVVHCMAGKGRTGCIIASYDVFCGNHIVPPSAMPLLEAAANAAELQSALDEKSSAPSSTPTDSASASQSSVGHGSSTTHHEDHVLQTPLDSATAALEWFGRRRGDSISHIAQKRTVLYTASIVHDCLVRYVNEVCTGVSCTSLVQLQISVSAATLHAAVMAAVRKLRPEDVELAHSMGTPIGLYAIMSAAVWHHGLPPLPVAGALVHIPGGAPPPEGASAPAPPLSAGEVTSQLITARSIVMHGVPSTPSGVFTPYIQILSLPSQAEQSSVRLYYNSAWDTPKLPSFACDPNMHRTNEFSEGVVHIPPWEAASAHYGGGVKGGPAQGHTGAMPSGLPPAEVIITQKFGSAVAMEGDILLRCLLSPGNTEVFRFSFHTAFLAMQPIPGVLRLTRDQLDVNKRNKKINKLPQGFLVDMFYTNEAVERAAGGASGSAPPPVLAMPSPTAASSGGFRQGSPQRSKVGVKSPVKRHFVAADGVGGEVFGSQGSLSPAAAAAAAASGAAELSPQGVLQSADYEFSDDDAEEGGSDEEGPLDEGDEGGVPLKAGGAHRRTGSRGHRGSVLDTRLGMLTQVPRSAVGTYGQVDANGSSSVSAVAGAGTAAEAAPASDRLRSRTESNMSSTSSTHTPAERQQAHAGVVAAANGTIKQGWMKKEGGFIRSWKERYFVLRQGTLSYYSDMASGDAKGVIDLRTVVGIRSCRPDEVPGRQHCLKLLSDSGRTYIFQAPDHAALEDWVVALASVHGALMA